MPRAESVANPAGTAEILRRREDFRHLYDQGSAYRSRDVVIVVRKTATATARFAVVASRKVGKAVRRNRAKRVLREAYRRLFRSSGLTGTDVALIARPGAPNRNGNDILDQLRDLYHQAGLLGREVSAADGAKNDSSP